MKIKLSSVIAPSFRPVHQDLKKDGHTHYWLGGGRGSTKSSFVAIEIILGIMSDPKSNCVALRKVKDTLKDSVYEQLTWAIDILGVEQYWHQSVSPLGLTYIPTGQTIKFRGADKPKKIKSIKFSKGYCKFIWYEEVDEFVGMEEIRMINQSLMRGGSKFTVFYSYNPPKSKNNWVNTEATFTREDRLTHHSTYLTVPVEWLGKQFVTEAEHLKKVKPTSYEHEYLGEVTGTGGEVFENVTLRPITDDEIQTFEVVRRGMDFGYAVDPFSYVVMAYNRKKKRLYIYHEVYEVGLSNYKAIDLIKEENNANELVTADSAEPKSIHEFRQHGLRVIGAKKGPDSVEYGIKFLQDLEEIIIDDTRCPNTAKEFLNYELEKDANGEFKAKFPDKDNHSIDAVRYGMNYEALKFRDEKKKKRDPDNPTPEERHEQMVKDVTGGAPPVNELTSW
jgi:phage terminase large subunit